MAENGSIQSVHRVMAIIEYLSDVQGSVAISEIAKAVNLNKSTVHRLLATLKSEGYVAQDEANFYHLTFKLCRISRQIILGVPIANVAKLHLKALSDDVKETAHLMVQEGLYTVYLHREESPKTSQKNAVLTVGKYLPLHVTSAGKSILAEFSDEELVKYWQEADTRKLTPSTIDNFNDLKQELKTIRECGYALDNEENTLGICCIGTSIAKRRNSPSIGLSISGIKERMNKERIPDLWGALSRTRENIMANMGYI